MRSSDWSSDVCSSDLMSVEAKGHRLDQRRPIAGTCARDRGMRRLINRAWLIAIDPHARYPVARGTVGNPFTRGALGVARVLGVLIVLADEDHRQLPHRCKVQRFMECADVRSAITEVGARHARFAAQMRGPRSEERRVGKVSVRTCRS